MSFNTRHYTLGLCFFQLFFMELRPYVDVFFQGKSLCIGVCETDSSRKVAITFQSLLKMSIDRALSVLALDTMDTVGADWEL